MWVQWYITAFLGTKLFRSVGLDLRTMVHVAFGRTLDECSPEYYPPEWLDGHGIRIDRSMMCSGMLPFFA